MIENIIKERAVKYTSAFKAELDKRQAEYKSGKAKTFTACESKKRIQEILNVIGK